MHIRKFLAAGAAATPRAAVVERSAERRVIFKEGLLCKGSRSSD